MPTHTETAAKLAELAPAMRTLTAAGNLYPHTPGGGWQARVTPYGLAAVTLGLEDAADWTNGHKRTERAVLHVRPAYAVTDDGTAVTNERDLAPHYRGRTRTEAMTPHPAAHDVQGLTQRNAALVVNGRAYTDGMTVRTYADGSGAWENGGLAELTDSARRKLADAFAPILAELDTPAARQAIRTRAAVSHAASAFDDAVRKLTDALDTLTAAGLIGGAE